MTDSSRRPSPPPRTITITQQHDGIDGGTDPCSLLLGAGPVSSRPPPFVQCLG
jgi:hypothetical protein